MRTALALLFVACSACAADRTLLFSFFRNNGEDGLYLAAASADGMPGPFHCAGSRWHLPYGLDHVMAREDDPGFQVIDGFLLKDGSRWAMVAKNETLNPPAKYLFTTLRTLSKDPGPNHRIPSREPIGQKVRRQ